MYDLSVGLKRVSSALEWLGELAREILVAPLSARRPWLCSHMAPSIGEGAEPGHSAALCLLGVTNAAAGVGLAVVGDQR